MATVVREDARQSTGQQQSDRSSVSAPRIIPVTQEEPDYIAALRTQGHPDANLLRAFRDQVGNDPINSNAERRSPKTASCASDRRTSAKPKGCSSSSRPRCPGR